MKNAIIIFLLFTLCGQTYAQSIVDFFYSIPAEYLDNLSYVERKQLIEDKSLTKDDMVYHITYDSKNGYLKLEQSYTGGQSGFGIFEITYWRLRTKVLIALSSVMGSNGGTHQNDFKLFTYDNKEFDQVRFGYLKDYTSSFDVFVNNLISEFTYKNTPQKIKDDLKYMGFRIELPRKGRDVRISFNPINETYFNREYSKYLKYRSKTYRFDKAKELFDPEF